MVFIASQKGRSCASTIQKAWELWTTRPPSFVKINLSREVLPEIENLRLANWNGLKGDAEDERLSKKGAKWVEKYHVVDKLNKGNTNGFLDISSGVTIANKVTDFESSGSLFAWNANFAQACVYARFLCVQAGVKFILDEPHGKLENPIMEKSGLERKITGIKTFDGKSHFGELAIVACEISFCILRSRWALTWVYSRQLDCVNHSRCPPHRSGNGMHTHVSRHTQGETRSADEIPSWQFPRLALPERKGRRVRSTILWDLLLFLVNRIVVFTKVACFRLPKKAGWNLASAVARWAKSRTRSWRAAVDDTVHQLLRSSYWAESVSLPKIWHLGLSSIVLMCSWFQPYLNSSNQIQQGFHQHCSSLQPRSHKRSHGWSFSRAYWVRVYRQQGTYSQWNNSI